MTSKHFTDKELACHHCGVNACTQELVDALELLRMRAGLPVIVDSAYRCPAHNASTPNAAKNSQHQEGTAADIKIPSLTAIQMYKVALTVPDFAAGGIGVAEHQGYIHVDVRPKVARWCYDIHGKSCAWDWRLDA